MTEMRMVVGLGNPGLRYVGSRHNMGFEVIDILAEAFGINVNKRKFGARLGSVDLEDKKNIRKRLEKFYRKVEISPSVEKEYMEMTRDYESAKRKYNEIHNKLLTAKVAKGMEETQRGERFTITEPAQLPQKPYKPNGVAIILIGFILALGAGVGLAAALEFVGRVQKRRAVVFLISDFLAPQARHAMAVCGRRHDLIAVRITDPREERNVAEPYNTWVQYPGIELLLEFQQSMKKYPSVPVGAPDSYHPPN